MDFGEDAEEIAQTIAEYGVLVLLEDGTTEISAIVDENYTSLRRLFSGEHLDNLPGRHALFHVTDEDFVKIGRGTTLIYDGKRWAQNSVRTQSAGRTVLMRVILGVTGVNP